jgi:hypothetical protein
MSFSLNQIDELRERTGVSYSNAKEALESCNGDMLEAIVYLEKNKKAKASRIKAAGTGFSDRICDLIRKGSTTRLIMSKQERTIINISVNVLVIIGLVTIPLIELAAIALLIALATGHKFRFESSTADISKVNETLERVSDTVEQAKDKLSGSITANTNKSAE